jgi:hypothetical protein
LFFCAVSGDSSPEVWQKIATLSTSSKGFSISSRPWWALLPSGLPVWQLGLAKVD